MDEAAQQAPQLIEARGAGCPGVSRDQDLGAFGQCRDAEDHDGDSLAQAGMGSYAASAGCNLVADPIETDQNEIGLRTPGGVDGILFISRGRDPVTVGFEQRLNPVAKFLVVGHYEDRRTALRFPRDEMHE